MPDINLVKLNVPLIMATVGGPTKLLALLDHWQPDHKLAYPRVHMWGQRGIIPGKYTAPVLYALEEAGYGGWRCFIGDAEEDEVFGSMTPLEPLPGAPDGSGA